MAPSKPTATSRGGGFRPPPGLQLPVAPLGAPAPPPPPPQKAGRPRGAEGLLARSVGCVAPKESEELKELMESWQSVEEAVFGPSSPNAAFADTSPLPPAAAAFRNSALLWLRVLLEERGLGERLPSALTLLDGVRLCEKTKDGLLAQEEVLFKGVPTTGVTIVAIVQILEQLHSADGSMAMTRSLLDSDALPSLFPSCSVADPVQRQMLGQAASFEQLRISALFGGRLELASPPDWASAIFARLRSMATVAVAGVASQAWSTVQHWALWITEMLAASPCFPPKALGIAACALGLMEADAMGTGMPEQQPAGGQELVAGQTPSKAFTFSCVAVAACCSEHEVRRLSFQVRLAREAVGCPSLAPDVLAEAPPGWLPAPLRADGAAAHAAEPHVTLPLAPPAAQPAGAACRGARPGPAPAPVTAPGLAPGLVRTGGARAQAEGGEDGPRLLTILVASFPRATLASELRQVFKPFGPTASAQVIVDRHGVSRCYGFVRFCSHEAVQSALDACAQQRLVMEDKEGVKWTLRGIPAKSDIPEAQAFVDGIAFSGKSLAEEPAVVAAAAAPSIGAENKQPTPNSKGARPPHTKKRKPLVSVAP